MKVLAAPYDVVLGPNVVEPDLIVAPKTDFTDRDLPVAPTLIVEIISPSTTRLDQGRKRQLYEGFGVASYWLIDPNGPFITVLELVDGAYVSTAHATGDEAITLTHPVPLRLTPAELLRD